MGKFDVFLSHNSKDKPTVRILKKKLSNAGICAWLDEDELVPGKNWQKEIEAGMKGSISAVICFGSVGVGPWEDEEMQALLTQAVKDRKRVIPVLLPDAPQEPPIPAFLGNRTWVDFREGFTDEGLDRLVWGITGKKPAHLQESYVPVSNTAVSNYSDERALREGICEEVDFLTPMDEPHFYLGVDVQPGHLAAGLVVERPAARQLTLKALEARRNVLIVGPSGSGKSALMWEVARAANHVEEWFQICRLSVEQLPSLKALVKACKASAKAPVGFVFDDVGCGLTEGWDALARYAASQPGIFLLGSSREEDMFLLHERTRAIEIRELGDNELAERLWKELRSRSQTQAPGWREPWRESKGLLLEYVHLLTQGSRLADVLRSQVNDRARDITREVELAVLRVTAAAGAAGAMVDVDRLSAVLNCPEAEISRALRRLIAEHLIRSVGPCRVGALHQLRAAELFRLCHEFPPPTPERTIAKALHCLPAEDIETFIVRICEINAEWQGQIVDEIAELLNHKPDPVLASSALRGLGQAHISGSVNAWLKRPEVQALPRTQISTAATFGLPGVGLPDIPKLAQLQAASRSFCSAVEISKENDLRRQLIKSLSSETLVKLFHQSSTLSELNELLSSFVGIGVSSVLHDQLRTLQPDLKIGRLEDVAKLLGTISLIDKNIAEAWVEFAGQQYLFERIYNEVPWVSRPDFRLEDEGLAVCADVHYVAASRQPDIHGEVVHLCELLLAIAPRAEFAVSNAIGPDGKVIGFGGHALVSKRIPRKNLPPSALPEWNKQWIKEVADRIAAPSYTDYLNRAIALLHDLVATLESILDEWFRKGKVSEANCKRLNFINDQAETLTPPRVTPHAATRDGNANKNEAFTKLQSVLFDCSANLITRFNKLPDGANGYIFWTRDIINNTDAAIEGEPWHLLIEGPPKELQRLQQIVQVLRLMAGEAGVRNVNPIQAWHKPKAQRKTAFRLAAIEAHSMLERLLAKTKAEIKRVLDKVSSSMNIHIRLNENENAPWPPAEVLITLSITDVSDWIIAIAENESSLREAVGFGRKIIVVPLVDGVAVDRLALGGVNTLFPHAGEAFAWLKLEGIAVLDDIRVRAFIAVTDPLTEISGIKQFGYGGKDRPLLEQEALTSAYLNLDNSLCYLRTLLASSPQILTQIEELVGNASSGQMPFATEMIASLHGEIHPAFVEILAIQNELLRLDIACNARL
jgi:energy-coupling factor transporter ATP-binding protein EcfA2